MQHGLHATWLTHALEMQLGLRSRVSPFTPLDPNADLDRLLGALQDASTLLLRKLEAGETLVRKVTLPLRRPLLTRARPPFSHSFSFPSHCLWRLFVLAH